MITKITGRHMDLTDAIRNYAEKKVARLQKHSRKISEMNVIIDTEGNTHKVEIIVKTDHHQPFVVTVVEEDAYACIDAAIDKIERQITRHKERAHGHKGRMGAAEASADALENQEKNMDRE